MKTLAALDLLVALLARAQGVSQLIQRAQAEGRDALTQAEFGQLVAADDAARARLEKAIQQAQEPTV